VPRSVEEWIGKTDDEPFPPRIKVRIFDRYGGQCACCSRIIVGHLLARFDHRISLINGGQNRESNGQLLCHECHDAKTKLDVAEKSVIYNKRIKRMGFKRKKLIPGSKGSGLRKRMDGTVWREK
jgi:5-methylcytosine-specific restriction endonuclease McrA